MSLQQDGNPVDVVVDFNRQKEVAFHSVTGLVELVGWLHLHPPFGNHLEPHEWYNFDVTLPMKHDNGTSDASHLQLEGFWVDAGAFTELDMRTNPNHFFKHWREQAPFPPGRQPRRDEFVEIVTDFPGVGIRTDDSWSEYFIVGEATDIWAEERKDGLMMVGTHGWEQTLGHTYGAEAFPVALDGVCLVEKCEENKWYPHGMSELYFKRYVQYNAVHPI